MRDQLCDIAAAELDSGRSPLVRTVVHRGEREFIHFALQPRQVGRVQKIRQNQVTLHFDLCATGHILDTLAWILA